MPTKLRTVIPGDPEDLICDTCPNRFAFRGTGMRTRESARVAGWHIHQEPNLDFKILCPECIGTPRTRIPAPPVLPGQTDALMELSVTMIPIVKKDRRGKGREMQ